MTAMRLLTAFALVFLAIIPSAGAQDAPKAAFFEALYDVPVMPGLEEVKDQALLFDKPDGRIASVVAASSTLAVGDVTKFYVDTLPQLGWEKAAQYQYVRNGERLTLEVSRRPPLTIVHFTLSPAVQHPGQR